MKYIVTDKGELKLSSVYVPNNYYMLKLSKDLLLDLSEEPDIEVQNNGDILYKDIIYPKEQLLPVELSEVANHLTRPQELTRVTNIVIENFWRKRTSIPNVNNVPESLTVTRAVVAAINSPLAMPRMLNKNDSNRLLSDIRTMNQCIDNEKEISLISAQRILNAFGLHLKDLFKKEFT